MLNQQLYNIHQLINTAEYINEKKEYYARIVNIVAATQLVSFIVCIFFLIILLVNKFNFINFIFNATLVVCFIFLIFSAAVRNKVNNKYEREQKYSNKILATLKKIIPQDLAELKQSEKICLAVRLERFGISLKQ